MTNWASQGVAGLLLKLIAIYVEVFEVSTIAVLQNKGTAQVNLHYNANVFLEP